MESKGMETRSEVFDAYEGAGEVLLDLGDLTQAVSSWTTILFWTSISTRFPNLHRSNLHFRQLRFAAGIATESSARLRRRRGLRTGPCVNSQLRKRPHATTDQLAATPGV